MKSVSLGFLLFLATAITLTLTAQKKQEAELSEPPSRIAITYWATPEEYNAYVFLCEFSRQSGKLPVRPETTEYSPTNFFQVQLQTVFTSWVTTRHAVEKDQTVRSMSATLQELEDKDLAILQNMIQAMRKTNAPPSPPQLISK